MAENIVVQFGSNAEQFEAELRKLSDRVESLNADLDKTAKAEGKVAAESQKAAKGLADVGKSGQQAGSQVASGAQKATGAMSSLKNMLSQTAGLLATFGVATGISSFAQEVIRATAQFEKFRNVLINTLGQIEGTQAFEQLKQFAATTNFSLEELTDGYIKMVNQGIQPSQQELVGLADVANSTGKAFGDLSEAVLDATRGENERLKQFGIVAKKSGDQTTFTFKGVETTVQNTSEAIQGYLFGLGQVEGVSGSTAAIAKTLGGQISNLGDNFTATASAVGDELKPAISAVIDGLNLLLDGLRFMASFVAENIAAVKTLAITLVALKLSSYAKQALAFARAQKILALASGGVTKALAAIRVAVMANPIGLLITAIGAGIAAFQIFNKETSEAQKQQEKFGKSIDDINAKVQAEKDEMNLLFEELKKTNAGSADRSRLVDEINSKYGKYLGNLLSEKDALEAIEAAQKAANIELERSIELGAFKELLSDLIKQRAQLEQDIARAIRENRQIAADKLDEFGAQTLRGISNVNELNAAIERIATTGQDTGFGSELIDVEALREQAKNLEDNINSVRERLGQLNSAQMASQAEGKKTEEQLKAEAKAAEEYRKKLEQLTLSVARFAKQQRDAIEEARISELTTDFEQEFATRLRAAEALLAESQALTDQAKAMGTAGNQLIAQIRNATGEGLASLVVRLKQFTQSEFPGISSDIVAQYDDLADKLQKGIIPPDAFQAQIAAIQNAVQSSGALTATEFNELNKLEEELTKRIIGITRQLRLDAIDNEYDRKREVLRLQMEDERAAINSSIASEQLKTDALIAIQREYLAAVQKINQEQAAAEGRSIIDIMAERRLVLLRELEAERITRKEFEERILQEEISILAERLRILEAGSKEAIDIETQLIEKRMQLRQQELEAEKALTEQRKDAAIGAAQEILAAVQTLNQAEVERTTRLVDQQREALDVLRERQRAGEKISADEVRANEERLSALTDQQEKFVRRQRELAALELVIQSTIAIAKAVASGDPFTAGIRVAAVLATLVAGLAAARSQAQSALPAFREGVVDFQGKGTGTSDSNIVRISKGESVITADATKKHKPLLEALNKGALDVIPVGGWQRDATALLPMQARHNRTIEALLGQINDNLKRGNNGAGGLTNLVIQDKQIAQAYDGYNSKRVRIQKQSRIQ